MVVAYVDFFSFAIAACSPKDGSAPPSDGLNKGIDLGCCDSGGEQIVQGRRAWAARRRPRRAADGNGDGQFIGADSVGAAAAAAIFSRDRGEGSGARGEGDWERGRGTRVGRGRFF